MISLLAFAFLVGAVIAVLELTHRRRSAEPHPGERLADDCDHRRRRQELTARDERSPMHRTARPTSPLRLYAAASVPAKASRAA